MAPVYILALFWACLFGLLAEGLKELIPPLKKYYIPRCFIGGILAILCGPKVLGDYAPLSEEVLASWDEMILTFVNIIFACVFLGEKIPKVKEAIKMALPQAILGQTMAWGQYAVGGLVTLFILGPFFGADESVASLIEVAFQGGIGVAVGMQKTYESLGAGYASTIGIALAPSAMVLGIVSGLIIINIYREKYDDIDLNQDLEEEGERKIKKDVSPFTKSLVVQLALVGLAIAIAYFLLTGLRALEANFLTGVFYEDNFTKHIPLFPVALIGGLILQIVLNRIPKDIVDSQTIDKIDVLSLDLVIIMALGNIDLSALGTHFEIFLILLLVGVAWNLFCFLFLAKRILLQYWFQRGIADFGQSMGTTSIGFLLQAIVDSQNKSRTRQAFGLKQIIFEPFLGGGIITALSPLLIHRIGLTQFTLIAAVICVLFLTLNFALKRWKKST